MATENTRNELVLHSLLFQKETQETANYSFDQAGRDHTLAYDLYQDFGFVVLESQPLFPTNVKDMTFEDYHDEDGVDVYNAGTLRFKEFDVAFRVATEGLSATCNTRFQNLLEYFTTNTCKMMIYSPIDGIGKAGVVYRGSTPQVSIGGTVTIEGTKFVKSILEVELKFLVTEPTSTVTCEAQTESDVATGYYSLSKQ